MTDTAEPKHLTITILPDGHINPSTGLVFEVTHAYGTQRVDIEVPFSEDDAAILDGILAPLIADALEAKGLELEPIPEPEPEPEPESDDESVSDEGDAASA